MYACKVLNGMELTLGGYQMFEIDIEHSSMYMWVCLMLWAFILRQKEVLLAALQFILRQNPLWPKEY